MFTFLLVLVIIITIIIMYTKIINEYKKRKMKENKEDIIKIIYKNYQESQRTNFQKLLLSSKIKTKELIKIIDNLIKERKIKYENEDINLTQDGIKIAQQIIQKHRNIEKYLFDNTSINLEKIHAIAEKEEHSENLNIIDKQENYECIDLHGDVIKGENIPSTCLIKIAQDLNNLGKIYKIVHIEDEPEEIYKEIVTLDLAPFEYIKIKNLKSNELEIITSKGQKIKIDFIKAENIFVTQVHDQNIQNYFEQIEQKIELITTLDKININQKAKIISISFYIRGEEKRRLLELGFVKNAIVQPLYNNMLGNDPRVYKIKNTMLALRKEQAQKIYVQKIS